MIHVIAYYSGTIIGTIGFRFYFDTEVHMPLL